MAGTSTAIFAPMDASTSGRAQLTLCPAPCRHCGRSLTPHRRGLCRACYRQPQIRRRYTPANTRLAGSLRRAKNNNRVPPLPPFPTEALPGTQAKVDVMHARVSAGYQPCHPHDAPDED